jgi:hypothetical protein
LDVLTESFCTNVRHLESMMIITGTDPTEENQHPLNAEVQ